MWMKMKLYVCMCCNTSDGNKRDDEMRRIGGNKMREGGGEDIGSIPNCAAALMNEFQFLSTQKNISPTYTVCIYV